MWTVIYLTRSHAFANKLKSLLTKEGILVKLKDVEKDVNARKLLIEVQVPESEAEEAQAILLENYVRNMEGI